MKTNNFCETLVEGQPRLKRLFLIIVCTKKEKLDCYFHSAEILPQKCAQKCQSTKTQNWTRTQVELSSLLYGKIKNVTLIFLLWAFAVHLFNLVSSNRNYYESFRGVFRISVHGFLYSRSSWKFGDISMFHLVISKNPRVPWNPWNPS